MSDTRREQFDEAIVEKLIVGESRIDVDTVTLEVPNDYDTVASALDELRERHTADSVEYEIMIESGERITEPIYTREEDLRHVTLTSEDDVVEVSDNFDSGSNVMEIHSSVGPVLDTKIDCRGNGDYGVRVTAAGTYLGAGTPSTGVINAGDNCLNASNCATVHAYRNDFSGAGRRGVELSRGSVGTFGRDYGDGPADFSGAAEEGIYVDRGGYIRAEETTIENTGGAAVRVEGGGVDIFDATITDPGAECIECELGYVNASGVTATGGEGVQAKQLGRINFTGGTLEGASGHGADANNGGWLCLRDAAVTGSQDYDISATNGSIIVANHCETTNTSNGDPHESDMRFTGLDTVHGLIFGATESA